MILGHLLLLASFTLLGPAPWLLQSPSLPLTITALFLQGAGSATVVVSSYSACLLSTLAIPRWVASSLASLGERGAEELLRESG